MTQQCTTFVFVRIFMSMAHQPPASNSASIIEHMASVLEAACNAKNGAWGFDVEP